MKMAGLETIGVSALKNGMIIKVKNSSGNVLWDATHHNNGRCQKIIKQMAENMNSYNASIKGDYIEKPYPIYNKLVKVGSVEIGSYGPFYLSNNDLDFINTLNKILISVGIFSLLFALVISSIMAKRLTSPISRLIDKAQMISKGFFTDRLSEKSSTKEICKLTSRVNELADILENQETLRKRLTADVTHELRTPLATLQSHMEAMIDGIWKPDTNRLKDCHEEVVRLSKMVGDLGKLAKYEGENLLLNKSSFDISELISQMILNFESEYMKNGLEIKFFGEEEIVNADKDKISQVIINLISNALKYTS